MISKIRGIVPSPGGEGYWHGNAKMMEAINTYIDSLGECLRDVFRKLCNCKIMEPHSKGQKINQSGKKEYYVTYVFNKQTSSTLNINNCHEPFLKELWTNNYLVNNFE